MASGKHQKTNGLISTNTHSSHSALQIPNQYRFYLLYLTDIYIILTLYQAMFSVLYKYHSFNPYKKPMRCFSFMLQMRKLRHGFCYLQFRWSLKHSSPAAQVSKYCVILLVFLSYNLPPKFLRIHSTLLLGLFVTEGPFSLSQLQCNEIQVLHPRGAQHRTEKKG